MTRVNEDIVRRFLDGELSAGEERSALHGIAEDPDARAMLRFDARLRGAVVEGARVRGEVPPGFSERVMAAIEAREAAAAARTAPADGRATADAGAGVPGVLVRAWNELIRPRTLVWRPAYAAGVVALGLLVAVVVLGPLPPGSDGSGDRVAGTASDQRPAGGVASLASTGSTGAEAERVLVRFVFAGSEAESVAVAGDFSRWDPIPLRRRDSDGQTVWTGLVAVPRGEHRYMFVLDGERWVTDPLATAVRDDGFGNRNAILSL